MNLRTVICGALGGTCPTVANLGAFYLANPLAAMPSPGLMVGMGLFAILGAIVAIGFGTDSPRAAIIAGIAAPAIVSSALDGATTAHAPTAVARAAEAAVNDSAAVIEPAPKPVPVPSTQTAENRAPVDGMATRGTGALLGGAMAQTVSPASPQMFRGLNMVTIQPVIQGSAPTDLRLEVVALIPGNVEVPLGTITSAEPLTVTLPAQAQAIRVGAAEIDVVPGRRQLDVVIEAAPTLRGDLLWALGAKRSLAVRDVQIAPRD